MADRSDSLKLYEDQPQEVTTADILRKYGPTEPDERGMLLPISRTGAKLSLDWPSAIYEPYQAIKRLVTRPVAPGYLSSSGDRGPIEDSFNAAAAVAAPSLGLNYAGMAPKNAVGIFGGRLAKTADQAALARAEEMAAKGADRRAIWDETGWFQGNDGKWRFEIDDSKSVYRPDIPVKDVKGALSHDPAYAAYPDLANVPFDRTKQTDFRGERIANGYFDPNKGIVVHDELGTKSGRSTMLHEGQHYIQEKEGFAKGYNSSEAAKDVADARFAENELLAKSTRMANAHSDEARLYMAKAEQGSPEHAAFVKEATDKWLAKMGARSEENPYGITPQEAVAAELGERDEIYNRLLTRYNDAFRTARLDPHELYKRHAGEVEARNVQKRMNMTPEERRATPPWETQDVPDTQQILRMYGPEGMSMASSERKGALPMDKESRLSRVAEHDFNPSGKTWYHGSARADRLVEKGELDPRRATSGPMPYFTDDPAMASSYAIGKKSDTSLMDDGDVSRYFTVSPKDLGHTRSRTPYTVEQSWHFLTPEQRATIAERALRIGYEDPEMATGALTLHQGERSITGADHYNYLLNREARGNHLKALRHLWHDSGALIDDPSEMAKVWRLAGYPHPISQYNAPWTEAPGVLPAYLAIQRPLVTTDQDVLKTKVIPALEEAFKRDRTRRKEFGADDWDKNTRYTPREWLDALKEDVAAGKNSFVWTSIPDKVTDALRKIGFDGIYDEGGKMGGQGHTVAIPFEKHQVRSAYAARFDPTKKDSGKLLASSAPTDPLTTQTILRQYGKDEE